VTHRPTGGDGRHERDGEQGEQREGPSTADVVQEPDEQWSERPERVREPLREAAERDGAGRGPRARQSARWSIVDRDSGGTADDAERATWRMMGR
jgi:hypothetical protein